MQIEGGQKTVSTTAPSLFEILIAMTGVDKKRNSTFCCPKIAYDNYIGHGPKSIFPW